MSDLVSVFVAEMEDTESEDWVQGIYDDCKAAIAAGAGTISALTSTSLNGKSFTKQLKADPGELMTVCRQALDIYRGVAVAATQADFRCMSR